VDGNAIRVHGKIELPVQVGDWKTTHTFLVADITTGPILVVEFLMNNELSIDLKEKLLVWRGGSFLELEVPGTTSGHCFLILSESVEIPAMNCMVANAMVVDEYGNPTTGKGIGFLEPNQALVAKTVVIIAHAVVSLSSNGVPVQMLATGSLVTLKLGTAVGELELLDATQPVIAMIQDNAY
jgi:hypothetical protein